MALSLKWLIQFVLAWHVLVVPARADVQWPQLKYTLITSLSQPVQITNAADGSNRLFFVTLSGTVRIYQGGQLLTTPFLDISARVGRGESVETGCFSIAFPPNYAGKHYFYIAYSRLSDGAVVLSRFTVPAATPNVADASSEQVLLVVPHPSDIHYGGQLAFGPDGYLYMSLGDGGPENDPSNNAQNPGLLLGKILRLDTEHGTTPYAIPPTNPFVNLAGVRPEIWAGGLRNPWRFSFDRAAGDLYIGDVGQDLWEEMDFQAAGSAGGQNYGWRVLEGTHPFNVPNGYDTNTLTPPAFQYTHQGPTEYGYAIIGGVVYRGPASRLTGIYLYADFGLGTISGATRDGGQWVTQTFDSLNQQISAFGEDEAGQVFVADVFGGSIRQIQEDTVTRTPTFNWNPGNYPFDITVTCTNTTPGATIHYTTNGVDPAESDPVYPSAGLAVPAPVTTLKVRAFHPYYSPSEVAGGDYTFSASAPTFGPDFVAINPTVGKDITISTSTPNSTIRYTLDGSVPTAASTLYTGSVHLADGPVTVKAVAFHPNYLSGAVGTGSWSAVQLATPQIGLDINGRITNGVLTFTGPGEIHYTVDGTTPTAASPLYTGPVLLTQTAIVSAVSFGAHYSPSSQVLRNVFLQNLESVTCLVASGSAFAGYTDSGTYTLAQYRGPQGICLDATGNTFYVADAGNHVIRRGTAFGAVTTVAGNGTAGYIDAAGTAARFNNPLGVCLDPAGNIYVADSGNFVVRKIDPAGHVTTYAGSGVNGNADGPGPQAQFPSIRGLAMDAAGNLFVGTFGGKIRKIDPQQNVSTFATVPTPNVLISLVITPAGRMFAVSNGLTQVFEVSSGGTVSVFAGSSNAGYSDGYRTSALFSGLIAIASDARGSLYVTNSTIVRKIDTDGTVSTLTDMGSLSNPLGLAAGPGGRIFISTNGFNRIYMASPNSSWPFAAQVTPNGAGQVVIQWPSVTGRNYALYYSDDLLTWTYAGSLYPGTGNVISVNQPLGGATHQFYKVKAL